MNAQAKATRTEVAKEVAGDKAGAPARRGRVRLGAIDRRTSPTALPVKPSEPPEVLWGQRSKDYRATLLGLCTLTLARSNCPADVRHVAEGLQSTISKASGGIFFPFRGDVGPVFKGLAVAEDMVTADDLIEQISGLYAESVGAVPEKRMAEIRDLVESEGNKRKPDEPRKPYLLPASLDDLLFENRQVHLVSNSLASTAAYLALEPEARLRQASVAMKFMGAVLEELAPYRIKNPINFCILCHRHDFDRQICRHHVEENRYTSSTVQRSRFQQAQDVNNKKLAAKLKPHRGLLTSLIEKERTGTLMLADVQAGFDAFFPGSELADTKTVWDEAVDDYLARCKESGMETEPVNVNALAWCWYAHPSIDDTKGFERLEQPLSSVLLKLYNDVHRFECYVDGGGEIIRKRRKSITATADIRKIGVMRQSKGASMREIGEAMGISTSQVKRILLELGID